jgi:hypothetical protein
MWPRNSEINDDDEQDAARQIKREREISGQTLPAIIIIIAPTTINHPSKQRNGA